MIKISLQTKNLLKASLLEDIGSGDVTSNLLIPKAAISNAAVFARAPGIFCGAAVVTAILRAADPRLKVRCFVRDGARFKKNQKVLEIRGPARSILKAERTVLNFLGHLSGIATETKRFVERAKKYRVEVLDTRKTTPLWRELEKYAVRSGGGSNHRMGLYDGIFVKENHRVLGDLRKLRPLGGRFEIEVRDGLELKQALRLGARVILFDNFSLARLAQAVKVARRARPEAILEASGGITLDNVRRFAAAGVDQISVGALTHSVKSIDFSLLIQ